MKRSVIKLDSSKLPVEHLLHLITLSLFLTEPFLYGFESLLFIDRSFVKVYSQYTLYIRSLITLIVSFSEILSLCFRIADSPTTVSR